jgi:hypothetical protein
MGVAFMGSCRCKVWGCGVRIGVGVGSRDHRAFEWSALGVGMGWSGLGWDETGWGRVEGSGVEWSRAQWSQSIGLFRPASQPAQPGQHSQRSQLSPQPCLAQPSQPSPAKSSQSSPARRALLVIVANE